MTTKKDGMLRHNGVSFLLPFAMITICFAMWGFANDITNPMVKAFSKIWPSPPLCSSASSAISRVC